MTKKDSIKIFEDSTIRTVWDSDNEKWYISIVDVVSVLTDSKRPRKYWSDLKAKLKKEGRQLSEKIGQLKMKSSDGKFYITDVADTEQLFRLIQFANSKVLVPNYNDPNDTVANAIIQTLYPNRTIVGIDVRNLYENGGMIHCVTQQQPME